MHHRRQLDPIPRSVPFQEPDADVAHVPRLPGVEREVHLAVFRVVRLFEGEVQPGEVLDRRERDRLELGVQGRPVREVATVASATGGSSNGSLAAMKKYHPDRGGSSSVVTGYIRAVWAAIQWSGND